MRKGKKIFLGILFTILALVAVLIALVFIDLKINPLLTEEQVKAILLEEVQPQLDKIARDNGLERLSMDIEFEEYEYYSASILSGNGVINITLSEIYKGSFPDLEAGEYTDDLYKKYTAMDRVDWTQVQMPKYDLYINQSKNSCVYADQSGNEYEMFMDCFWKNNEIVAAIGSMAKLQETIDKYGGKLHSNTGGSSSGKEYGMPLPGESLSDYIKREDPELYKSMKEIYEKNTKQYRK
ncbi:MAG: hypothetical protein E7223_07875 [Clostridiales bacterium]|nr:hypothetical protein [Clostridiales bacterium]